MKRIIVTLISIACIFNLMAQTKIVQTAGRDALGEFAPEFARLNDDILFGEVWSRNDLLSLRDRSLVTITALISQGITDSGFSGDRTASPPSGASIPAARERARPEASSPPPPTGCGARKLC